MDGDRHIDNCLKRIYYSQFPPKEGACYAMQGQSRRQKGVGKSMDQSLYCGFQEKE